MIMTFDMLSFLLLLSFYCMFVITGSSPLLLEARPLEILALELLD